MPQNYTSAGAPGHRLQNQHAFTSGARCELHTRSHNLPLIARYSSPTTSASDQRPRRPAAACKLTAKPPLRARELSPSCHVFGEPLGACGTSHRALSSRAVELYEAAFVVRALCVSRTACSASRVAHQCKALRVGGRMSDISPRRSGAGGDGQTCGCACSEYIRPRLRGLS